MVGRNFLRLAFLAGQTSCKKTTFVPLLEIVTFTSVSFLAGLPLFLHWKARTARNYEKYASSSHAPHQVSRWGVHSFLNTLNFLQVKILRCKKPPSLRHFLHVATRTRNTVPKSPPVSFLKYQAYPYIMYLE